MLYTYKNTRLTKITLSGLVSFPLAANIAFIFAAAAAAAAPLVVVSVSVVTMSHFERRFLVGGTEISLLEENKYKKCEYNNLFIIGYCEMVNN